MRRPTLLLGSMALALLLACGVALAVERNCKTTEHFCMGTSDSDTLNGTEEKDRIFGLEGDDTLLGNGGDDALKGGFHRDTLYGGNDHDYLEGGKGEDRLFGEGGEDYLTDYSATCEGYYGCFDDFNVLSGGRGNDELYGHGRLNGGSGNDIITGSETLTARPRTINGGTGQDRIGSLGSAYDDIYAADGEKDTVSCGGGSDTVYYDKGIDKVNPRSCEERIAQ